MSMCTLSPVDGIKCSYIRFVKHVISTFRQCVPNYLTCLWVNFHVRRWWEQWRCNSVLHTGYFWWDIGTFFIRLTKTWSLPNPHQTTVSTFVSVTPLGWDNSHPCSRQQKSDIHDEKPVHLQLWRPKQVFYAKTWSFPNPDQVVFVPRPNQTKKHSNVTREIWKWKKKQKVQNKGIVKFWRMSGLLKHNIVNIRTGDWAATTSTQRRQKQKHRIWT